MLYGTPSAENPDGRQIAGVPAKFIGTVKRLGLLSGGSFAARLAVEAALKAVMEPYSVSFEMGHAGAPPAGHASASTAPRTAVSRAVISARIFLALTSCASVAPAPSCRNSWKYGPYSLARDG